MMQAFRNAAKPVVYLITITFMSWMILDLSGITGKGGFFTQTSVGSINGQAIEQRAYQAAVQQELTRQQQSSGNTLSLEQSEAARNSVWDQFVETALIDDQIARNHITTSPDEITEYIKNLPPQEFQSQAEFQTNGSFDLTKYQRWLAGPVGQQYVPALEQQTQAQVLRSKLFTAVTDDLYLSDAELWQRYRDQNEQVRISLTPIVSTVVIPDSAVAVNAAEIETYYKAHSADFSRPKTAFMSFVPVPHRLEASDTAAALARAQQLRSDIAGGQAFADVAKRESSDTASGKNGGDLGELTRTMPNLDTAFAKAAFALPLNTVSEPVRSAFGYHLIEVTKKTTDKKDGDKITVRHILIPIELAGAHRAMVDAQTDSLQRLAAERLDPAALDTVARALKLPIGKTGPVPAGTRVQLGTSVIPDAGIWAFQAKVGETSPVIDGEAASYVFRLDSVQAAGTPPLVQVRDAVAAKVREQKKDVKAKALAAELLSRVKAGATLPDASKALGLKNRELGPFPRTSPPLQSPQIIGASFGLPAGSLSNVIDTPEGLYVIRVLDHTNADTAAFLKDKDQLRAQAIQTERNVRVREYVASLKDNAKIIDRRGDLERTNAQNEAALAAQQGKVGKP
jgi:peptidyl-prolyl cis-trans isomerase D